MEVIRTTLDPSLSHNQISPAPARFDRKAIFFPSREKLGESSSFVDGRKGLEGFRGHAEACLRQRFRLGVCRLEEELDRTPAREREQLLNYFER
jgi:hypothetical protein